MSFVQDNLLSNEQVLAQARLHKIILLNGPTIFLLGILSTIEGSHALGTVLFILGLLGFIMALLRFKTTEFALTNRRVIAKWGILSRHTIELNLDKIEGVNVSQGILGRMLGYGSVILVGTGGSAEPMKQIADPFAIRKAIQEKLSA